ncbi:ABC transporter permease [Limibacillus sp. MBR-115]|uniref:ABC transporter permease n=1 Tax=Limibacillus sp. MBR-115 TaxID=3156465 RepID=UPI003394E645
MAANPTSVATTEGRWKQRLTGLPFVLPLLVFLSLFFYWPLAEVLVLSVTEPEVGFSNFTKLLSSAVIHKILITTFMVTFETTLASVAIGYLMAFAIVHSKSRTIQRSLLLCVIVPFWMSIIIRAFAWLILLRGNGIVNETLIGLGLIDSPLQLSRNELGVVIGVIHIMVPIATLTILGNLRSISPSYVKAARSLGASPWFAFRAVYFPISLPGLIGASMITFMFTLGFFITPALLGGGRVIMVAEYISVKTLVLAQLGEPAMLAVVLMASVFLLLMTLGRALNLRELLSGGSK